MSVDYIPFINSSYDCEIANKLYSDAALFRISLETAENTCPKLPDGPKRWIDPAIDGLPANWDNLTDSYKNHVKRFAGFEKIANPQFHAKPDYKVVQQFVKALLDACNKYSPDWISIPQLPILNDSTRNRINKQLAEGAKSWKEQSSFSGKLILPCIFTNQKQINKKTERNKKIANIIACYTSSSANGVWVVDASLNDQEGSGKFDIRFPAIRDLHEELNKELSEWDITISGPYWGINLTLWARGLTKYTAVGLGNSYKYNIPGAKLREGKVRVAVTPLRRWAIASPKLRKWLVEASSKLSPADPTVGILNKIEKNFPQQSKTGRFQVAMFYRQWFQKFASLPPSGRALALYQDLSSAYVLGTNLPDLPPEEGTARRPERVAQQLMMNCL